MTCMKKFMKKSMKMNEHGNWSGFDDCDWGMLIAIVDCSDIIFISPNIPRYLIEVSMNDWELTRNNCYLILLQIIGIVFNHF